MQIFTRFTFIAAVADAVSLVRDVRVVIVDFEDPGKSPNMRLNNTDFKELLFYGVRAVA